MNRRRIQRKKSREKTKSFPPFLFVFRSPPPFRRRFCRPPSPLFFERHRASPPPPFLSPSNSGRRVLPSSRHHRSVFRPRIRPPLFQIVLTGEFLAMLPLDPKLGKMLIMGAIFRCFDPILTIVAGLSVRDPFLLPQDKKDLAGTAKARYSAKDYSDHMALVRAFEGWKDAEREGSAYEYCWRNYHSILV